MHTSTNNYHSQYSKIVKDETYYYIDTLIKDTTNKQFQQYIFEIKMKLIHCDTLQQFESFIDKEYSCVSQNFAKLKYINLIKHFIKTKKKSLCKHFFENLQIDTSKIDENLCHFEFENKKEELFDSQQGWFLTCSKCNITTNELGIKLGFDTNTKFPNYDDFFHFLTIAEQNGWHV